MNEWTNEWMNEWMSEWMNEWMNEWMQLLSYGTILAVEWSGSTMPRISNASVWCTWWHYTAVTRQTLAAKSHPVGSPLCLSSICAILVPTHPAESSKHVWDPFLPVFLVNRQTLLPASSLSMLKGKSTCLSLLAVGSLNRTFWLQLLLERSMCSGGRHTDFLSPLLCSGLSGGCLPNQQVHWLGLQQQQTRRRGHAVLIYIIECVARYGSCLALAKPCKAYCCVISCRKSWAELSYTAYVHSSKTATSSNAVLVCFEACSAVKFYV